MPNRAHDPKISIGFDARTLSGQQGGIGRYATNLIKALLHNFPENTYILFGNRSNSYARNGSSININNVNTVIVRKLPTLPVASEIIWSQIILPLSLQIMPVNLYHGLDFYVPIVWRGKSVVTIHDLSYEFFHDDFPLRTRLKNRILVKKSCVHAYAVITDSQSTTKDLIEVYGIPESKIFPIYLGIDEKFQVIENLSPNFLDELGAKYGINQPYILSVGDIRPRKNLFRLLQAFTHLLKTGDYDNLQLVIVGKQLHGASELTQYVRNLGLNKKVRFIGYVPDDFLPQLYNAASLFVQPSLYEGFGFSALEALACGVPTAVSKISSLPEVCGEGAIYFNPKSVDEMVEAIKTVLRSKPLRDELQTRGIRKAKEFSWEKTARETYAIYQKVVGHT